MTVPVPSKHDVDVTIRSLELDEGEAAKLREFYDQCRREAWKQRLQTAWRIIRIPVVITCLVAILYVLALLWIISGLMQ